MPTPNGASLIHAFSTIVLIFFSSSDHATIPLDHKEVPLAASKRLSDKTFHHRSFNAQRLKNPSRFLNQ
jgi:hypothetical protein